MNGYKTCNICKLPKALEFFYKNKTKPDGYALDCKSCESLRKRKFRQENPDWYLKQRDGRIRSQYKYKKKRLAKDPMFRMKENLRRRLSLALNRVR